MILIYQLLSRRDCQSCSAGWRLTKFPTVFLLSSLLLRNVKVNTARKFWWHEMIDETYLCSQFFDVQRKDFWEMFIHHNTTIALIALSWTAHFTRVIRGLSDLKFTFDVCFQQVGTLVILVHDCSDHLLEFAKLLKYTGFQSSCDIFFGLFAVTWVVTRCQQQQQRLMKKVWLILFFRCGVFPAWILYSTVHDAGNFFELSPLYYLFLVLLGLLQLLNLIWTFMLVKAIRSAIIQQGAHDSRSDSESSSMDEQDENYNLDVKKKDWYSTRPPWLSSPP